MYRGARTDVRDKLGVAALEQLRSVNALTHAQDPTRSQRFFALVTSMRSFWRGAVAAAAIVAVLGPSVASGFSLGSCTAPRGLEPRSSRLAVVDRADARTWRMLGLHGAGRCEPLNRGGLNGGDGGVRSRVNGGMASQRAGGAMRGASIVTSLTTTDSEVSMIGSQNQHPCATPCTS